MRLKQFSGRVDGSLIDQLFAPLMILKAQVFCRERNSETGKTGKTETHCQKNNFHKIIKSNKRDCTAVIKFDS